MKVFILMSDGNITWLYIKYFINGCEVRSVLALFKWLIDFSNTFYCKQVGITLVFHMHLLFHFQLCESFCNTR